MPEATSCAIEGSGSVGKENSAHPSPDEPIPTEDRVFRILVVDDFDDNRELLRRRLTRLGHEVLEACDGFEALRILDVEKVDLVLLDIMMPGMDGTEVVKTIRQTRSSLQLPVIMVSAKDQSGDVAHCLRLGANDYITKPIDFTVGLARIEAHLARTKDHEICRNELSENVATRLNRAVAESYESLRLTNEELERETQNRRRTEERAEYLAHHDALTGLRNRASFYGYLEQCLTKGKIDAHEPALVLVDLDHFKVINDTHGHLVGDQLLYDVAVRIQGVVLDRGVLARLGSDEFAVLVFEEGHPSTAYVVGEAIVDAIAKPFTVSTGELWLSAHCGVARAASCSGRPEMLVRAADLAMRRAKVEGGSRITVFEPGLLEAQRERSEMEVGLRRALHHGELELYYQPMVRSSDHTISCMEALVRWNHPEKGVILPEAFIPVAEEVGLSCEIGWWILHEACREATTWPHDLNIAVNVSPVQFIHPQLPAAVASALSASRLHPGRLELEITETCFLNNDSRCSSILKSLQNIGVRISIDDFGTGYYSMNSLRDFQFDKLKIDRRFIECLGKDITSDQVVSAVAELGIRIGIGTTAEGVDTELQLTAVVKHGCSEIQGYYISKPLTRADVHRIIERR